MREKILMNRDWLFLGEVPEERPVKTKSGSYLSAKTGRLKWGPGVRDHVDMPGHWDLEHELTPERWQSVDLPHDYIISQTPDPVEVGALGFFKYHHAWYRKHFTVDKSDADKRITIYFEGVTGNSEIYLNSCLVYRSTSGYASFEVDITDIVDFESDNVLAVHVDPESYEGWWYQGAGIYRNVWMVKTPKTAIDLYGVFLPVKKLDESRWQVPVEVEVFNIDYKESSFDVNCKILSPAGEVVAGCDFAGSVASRSRSIVKGECEVSAPELWDINNPVRYTAVVTLTDKDGNVFDSYEQKFGFRTIRFCNETGFYLNGRNVKIKGVCAHLDFGLTGKAVPDNICRHKVKLCKDMGANAYRTSHYPHQDAVMEACDTLGVMVMDENRRFETTADTFEHLEMLVKRDRNRPSVIIWSTGNEEMVYHTIDQGKRIHRALEHRIKQLDPTRPVTCAMTNIFETTLQDVCEVVGANYFLLHWDELHAKTADKPFVSSENCATGSTRGWYWGDCAETGRLDARDREVDFSGAMGGRKNTWKTIAERPWCAGGFQWDAFEHRGEAIWPRLCSVSGAYDLFLQKKDAFYQNQSHWLDEPMIHVLPHWTHPGMEGRVIDVWCYTNCEEAELFLNGRSLGRKSCEKYTPVIWQVEYVPGKIEVKGYNAGKVCAEDSHVTCGEPVRLALKLETPELKANHQDVAFITCSVLDAQGNEVPYTGLVVDFATSGAGKIVGTGSDNTDHVPVPSCSRKMYAGLISVAVKCLEGMGDKFTLRADAPGVISTALDVVLQSKNR
ncbi:MAG: DUF4982 domain-containing protein [Lentisphaeria bacterium]|nr:DUF4982 domain-containing protein [Lentisphaeria bacterium]